MNITNNNEINSFLAERAMGWKLGINPMSRFNPSIHPKQFEEWQSNSGFGILPIDEFNPMNDIEHAFWIQAEIAKMGKKKMGEYAFFLNDWDLLVHIGYSGHDSNYYELFNFTNATAAQRSEAAMRTLGTDAEIARLL